jgi:predicted HicB family RNase H-like nuclease
METRNREQAKERMVHVRLPETIHKKVCIRAAETDQTIQDWVFADVRNVAHQRLAPILLSGGQTT